MVRHGKTYGNTQGRYIGTTDEHLMESESDALLDLSFSPVQCVFVSPMIRCRETALLIFPEQEYMMIDGFRECDFGEFENKNYQELSDRKSYQQWIDSEGTLGFPGGESMLEFKERTLGAFDQMIQYCIQKKYDNIFIEKNRYENLYTEAVRELNDSERVRGIKTAKLIAELLNRMLEFFKKNKSRSKGA